MLKICCCSTLFTLLKFKEKGRGENLVTDSIKVKRLVADILSISILLHCTFVGPDIFARKYLTTARGALSHIREGKST